MFRFTIRDVLWLTVVVGLTVALVATHRQASSLESDLQNELARNELIAELWRPTSMDFTKQRLSDVIKYLSQLHAVPFVLDTEVNGAVLINGTFKGVSLRDGLQGILAPLDLDFRVKDGAILIEQKHRP